MLSVIFFVCLASKSFWINHEIFDMSLFRHNRETLGLNFKIPPNKCISLFFPRRYGNESCNLIGSWRGLRNAPRTNQISGFVIPHLDLSAQRYFWVGNLTMKACLNIRELTQRTVTRTLSKSISRYCNNFVISPSRSECQSVYQHGRNKLAWTVWLFGKNF